MTILTEKTVFGGDSIAKIDGKTLFIPYTMPGESLEIQITEEKKDYDRAIINKIVKASVHRVEPECKYYQKCGGCNMMHIDYAYQQELRVQMLKDIFLQEGIKLDKEIEVVSGPQFNYRSRFQLNNGGLSQKGSNITIGIDHCMCAEEVINNYLKETSPSQRPQGRSHLFGSSKIIESGQNNSQLIIDTKKDEKKEKQIVGRSKKAIKIKQNHYFSGSLVSPENRVKLLIGQKEISFDVRGFFQSNLFVFEKVTKLICDCLKNGDNVLDMYAGCGSISTFLADKYQNTILVEHNRDALVFAEENMAGKKHISYGLSGANWVKNCSKECPHLDACVVDPPRSGMEKEVRDFLCQAKIPELAYLSCNPSTQARDTKDLIKAGYKIRSLYLLDFYPNTSHIESLIIFDY